MAQRQALIMDITGGRRRRQRRVAEFSSETTESRETKNRSGPLQRQALTLDINGRRRRRQRRVAECSSETMDSRETKDRSGALHRDRHWSWILLEEEDKEVFLGNNG